MNASVFVKISRSGHRGDFLKELDIISKRIQSLGSYFGFVVPTLMWFEAGQGFVPPPLVS